MVNLSDIQELNRKELLRCLRKFDSPISLIWDPNLTAPFTLFSDVKLLQEYGVEKMVALPESGRLAGFQTKYAVFLCSDTVSIIERVANVTPAQSNTEYHLIIVPKISVINKKLLREKGCYNDQTDKPGKIASIIPCFIELFMLNTSLITLNIVNSYRKLIDRDQCLPSTTARSLMTFQATFGVFPKILACGKTSCATVDLLLSSRKELIPQEDKISSPQFASLLLIDRSTDIVSPLLTPTSYNALLERFLEAKWNKVPVKQAEKPDKTVHLTNDPFFNEIRNVHVKHAARIISQKLRTLKSSFDERESAKSIQEYKAFVARMPQLNKERETLNNHSDLATEILDKLSTQPVELEHAALANSPEESMELICSGEIQVPFEEALKIFVFLCWRNNGLSQKFLDAYRGDLLNIYGHDRLLCFMKAAQCGILYAQSEKNARLGRDIFIKGLKLNETNNDLFNPSNQSFVFGNKWTPLVSRLVLESSAGSWRRIDELLKSTKIPFREEQQDVEIAENQRATAIFVFMIGGITASEIAALSHLSNQLGREIIVGCTETITGKSFISQIVN